MSTFKLLKITLPKGDVNYIPNNSINREFHNERKRNVIREKQEKYLIEEVELSVEEAAAIGVAEAIQILNPPKAKKSTQLDNTNTTIELLLQQNKMLMARLEALEGSSSEEKPTKKK